MKRLALKEQNLMVEIMLLVEQLDCVLNKAISTKELVIKC